MPHVSPRWMLPAALLAAAPALATPPGSTADRRLIEAGEKAWGNAFVKGDAATVDRLLAPDFVGTGPDGLVYDKPTMLGWLHEPPTMVSNTTTVVRIRFFGTTAVVNGRDAFVTTGREAKTNAWTDVWAYRSSRWRIVSAQDTRLAR